MLDTLTSVREDPANRVHVSRHGDGLAKAVDGSGHIFVWRTPRRFYETRLRLGGTLHLVHLRKHSLGSFSARRVDCVQHAFNYPLQHVGGVTKGVGCDVVSGDCGNRRCTQGRT